MGTQSMYASATPDNEWVTPAPGTTLTTPTWSDVRAMPSAMNDADCSWVTSTGVSSGVSSMAS